jgi:steroid 5-alpha reductase family enzyme
VAATGRWLNWSVLGVVLLILLFQGSTQFTEKISLGKYPEYAEYRRRVPRFLPRPWARRPVF